LSEQILSEAGRIAARRRWGRQRVLRLDTLPESVRSAIEALIAAEERAQAREAAGRRDAA
jgi:hypothetical protein